MPLADYLAQNYLSADTAPAKKRKRKAPAQTSGLVIADDDPNDWTNPPQPNEDDDDAPAIVGGALSAGLNKPSKKTKWLKVGARPPTNTEQAAADAILQTAQTEAQARTQADDDAPAVVGDDGEDVDAPMMASGAAAGLQTGEQVAKQLQRKARAERQAMSSAGLDPSGQAQETIYRDASGRIINVAMKRAELRAKAEEDERKRREELEGRKGDVQRWEKEERRRELEDARGMGVARGVDDREMNEELRGRARWNDPMAPMMAAKGGGKGREGKGGGGGGGGKAYLGAFEPNRYGVRPGWRWDGVDRGNGFERKWFQARNKKRDVEELKYAWQMDE